jgi:hypothetical protein
MLMSLSDRLEHIKLVIFNTKFVHVGQQFHVLVLFLSPLYQSWMGALEFQLTSPFPAQSFLYTDHGMIIFKCGRKDHSDILFVISGVRAQTNKIGSAIISISISLAVTSRRELRNMSVSTQALYGL